jgi:hypothetical protein
MPSQDEGCRESARMQVWFSATANCTTTRCCQSYHALELRDSCHKNRVQANEVRAVICAPCLPANGPQEGLWLVAFRVSFTIMWKAC